MKLDILEMTAKGQPETQETGSEVGCNLREDLRHEKRGEIISTILVADHQVVRNLVELSEITLAHLYIYADYLGEKELKFDSRAVRALLTTEGQKLMRVDGHYIEVYGPYPILVNVDGINFYTKAHLTNASDQAESTSVEKNLRCGKLDIMPCSSRIRST